MKGTERVPVTGEQSRGRPGAEWGDQVIRPQGEGGNALSPLFITITFSGPMLSHFR